MSAPPKPGSSYASQDAAQPPTVNACHFPLTLQYPSVPHYIRYRSNTSVSYGILDGDAVRELRGDLFQSPAETGVTHQLSEVKLLHPCLPGKILCVGLNYRSHLGGRPQPANPEM